MGISVGVRGCSSFRPITWMYIGQLGMSHVYIWYVYMCLCIYDIMYNNNNNNSNNNNSNVIK